VIGIFDMVMVIIMLLLNMKVILGMINWDMLLLIDTPQIEYDQTILMIGVNLLGIQILLVQL
jgi:hypothetical protein